MPPASGIELQPEAATDFANYFVSYGYLYHQKDMLQDKGRMDGYRNAILGNAKCFEGKTVLDVGTGSGVLAIWAGMAGARKVYAVEATSMAQQARRLVQQNGMQDIVTVLEGYMEKIELPEKVRARCVHCHSCFAAATAAATPTAAVACCCLLLIARARVCAHMYTYPAETTNTWKRVAE